MVRTALRLSTVAALLNGGNDPLPTLALGHVYDSRHDPIDDLVATERMPAIVVRTDDDTHAMPPRDQRTILLRLEISVLSARYEADEDGAEHLVIGWPQTDSGLEAMLDLLEWQVWAALLGSGPWARFWLSLWGRSPQIQSVPLWLDPSAKRTKLAAREITIAITAQADCLPAARIDLVDEPPPAFIGLPPPLPAVFNKIAADGAGDHKIVTAQLRAQLEAQELPSGTLYPPLLRFTQLTTQSRAVPVDVTEPLADPPPP